MHCRSLGRSALARVLDMTKHFTCNSQALTTCTQKKERLLFREGWRMGWIADGLPANWLLTRAAVFGRFPRSFDAKFTFCSTAPASWVSCWAQCQPVVNYHRPTDDLTADAWPTPGSCRRQFFQNNFNLFGGRCNCSTFWINNENFNIFEIQATTKWKLLPGLDNVLCLASSIYCSEFVIYWCGEYAAVSSLIGRDLCPCPGEHNVFNTCQPPSSLVALLCTVDELRLHYTRIEGMKNTR